MRIKQIIDLRWIKPLPMGGVETYAKLGAKAFLNRDDTLILIPRNEGFNQLIDGSNVCVDKYFALNFFFPYLKWLFNLAFYYQGSTIITFNYYTPLFNLKTLSTIMDLRLLQQNFFKKYFFKINILGSKFSGNKFYAISPYVQEQSIEYFNRNVSYIPTFLEPKRESCSNKYNLDNFALIISSDLPHKNLRLLYEIENYLPLDLVIIGPVTNSNFNYNSKKISHLGFVSLKEKHELIFKAKFIIFPTTFEGFGYPVLEAALFGKRILCNKLKVFETLFEDFPVYVNSNDRASWIKAIEREYNIGKMNINLDVENLEIDKRVTKYFDKERFVNDILQLIK